MQEADAEAARISDVYAARKRELPASMYSVFEPGTLYMVQRRERATLALLRAHGLTDLSAARILDVGCGAGGELLRLVQWGAAPDRLAGVDLLEDRIAQARDRLPAADLRVGDGRALPFPDGAFDLVTQFTVFSSVLDPAIRSAIAAEMLRVVRPGGRILWCDMWVVRPGRPLAAMPEREIRRLFPGCRMDMRREVLNPLLSRKLARFSWWACDALALLPQLRTYNIALITCDSSS